MGQRWSNQYAPYGTCPNCGWTGRDWGFKYHNFCRTCYNQWRKKQAEDRKKFKQQKLKQPNCNMEIADGLVVTRNVRERLLKQSHLEIPFTKRLRWSELCEGIGIYSSLIIIFVLIFTYYFSNEYALLLVICAITGYFIALLGNHIQKIESAKHGQKVNARLEHLARSRQQRIDEASMFYASSEWRLVRNQFLQEQGRICQECGQEIKDDFDLTVDHIKPRSKFPELALDVSNLRVLCRSCNSTKGATYDE